MIVVDDASDFDVTAYLEKELGSSPNLIVIHNPANHGGALSRNIGVDQARGDFIALLDSDDYWLPHKLEKQMAIFDQHPDTSVVCCDVYRERRDGQLVGGNRQLHDSDIWTHLLNGWVTFPNTSSLVFKKRDFQRVGGFDPELKSCQDHDLWMRIGQQGLTVRYVPEPLYVTTSDQGNRITSDYVNRMRGIDQFMNKWEAELLAHGGESHLRWYRNQYNILGAFDLFVARIRQRQIGTAWRIYRSYFMRNSLFYSELLRRALPG
jgi:glycosyltransferase involved in cell wall biosynthesis